MESKKGGKWGRALSERENGQAGDFPEVARVAGRHGVPALQCTGTDQKIVERDGHAFLVSIAGFNPV